MCCGGMGVCVVMWCAWWEREGEREEGENVERGGGEGTEGEGVGGDDGGGGVVWVSSGLSVYERIRSDVDS